MSLLQSKRQGQQEELAWNSPAKVFQYCGLQVIIFKLVRHRVFRLGGESLTESKNEEFSGREWAELLSKERKQSNEKVIITGTFSRTLRINKQDWDKHFTGSGGFAFKQGKEVEIITLKAGDRRTKIPEWVWNSLKASAGERYCITERGGRYYLKKLELTKRKTSVPGITVIDSFDWDIVSRMYADNLDIQRITSGDLKRLLGLVGRFRYDPISPFEKMTGRIGYLGRKELLGRPNKADKQFLPKYEQQFAETQLENGSWEDNTMVSAFNIIKLHETGVASESPALTRGVKWLLSTSEPHGFPGLFMLTDKLVSRFNAWKASQPRGPSGRPHRRTTDGEARRYIEHRDILSSISAWPCELRLTWTSGIAIEALLRCGLHQEPRVIKAINTLLNISERGRWCGCGYFDTRDCNFVPESLDPIDFNRLPVFQFSLDDNSAARLVCDNRHLLALEAGKNRAFLTTRFRSSGECPMVVSKALSFHPRFSGSNFEANSALSSAGYLGMDGVEEEIYLSSVFALLTGMTHAFAAFLVLRSIPVLIRKQGRDGLWREKPIGECPPPSKEESSLMILRALKKFGFLDSLLP
jgi:hypothetical protein